MKQAAGSTGCTSEVNLTFVGYDLHTMNYPKKQVSICTNRGIVPI